MKVTFHFDNDGDQEKKALGTVLLAAVVILAELIVVGALAVGLLAALDLV